MSTIVDTLNAFPAGYHIRLKDILEATSTLGDEGLCLKEITSAAVRHELLVCYHHDIFSMGFDEEGKVWLYPSRTFCYDGHPSHARKVKGFPVRSR